MRRLTQKRLKEYKLFPRPEAKKDGEGNRIVSYGEPKVITAQIWAASDSVQRMMYGERANSLLNMLYPGDEEIKKGDGICVYAENEPDYKVISVLDHEIKFMELEKI